MMYKKNMNMYMCRAYEIYLEMKEKNKKII